jgi:hypothetical protein
VPRPRQAIGTALLLAGCAGLPQDADQFRRAASAAWLPKTRTLEVGRAFADVAATWREKAAECLEVSVTATTKTITNYQEIIRTYHTTYKSTVVVGAERAELQVQWRTRGELHASTLPAGGAYRLVADAYPVQGGRTRLQLYNLTSGDDFLANAVTAWATGENKACPDLTTQW